MNEMFVNDYINTIINGDCLEIMKIIPDNSFDVTFADPPFNLKKKYNSYKDKNSEDEYIFWCKKWLFEMVRITKPSGSIFVHNIPKWLIYYGSYLNDIAFFKHWIAWDAMSSPLGKTLLPNHYGILYYAKSKTPKFYDIRTGYKRCRHCKYTYQDYGGKKNLMHPYGPILSDVWTDIHRIKHKTRRDEHPCQLPVHLVERLLLFSSDENDIIFDPFVGTGTTAIAAKKLGRRFIGIDVDKSYAEIAQKKISETKPTMINHSYVSSFLNRIVTIRCKDWEDIRDSFIIPKNIVDIERTEIQLTSVNKEAVNKSKSIKKERDLFLWIDSDLLP